jgi:hypothetical protein
MLCPSGFPLFPLNPDIDIQASVTSVTSIDRGVVYMALGTRNYVSILSFEALVQNCAWVMRLCIFMIPKYFCDRVTATAHHDTQHFHLDKYVPILPEEAVADYASFLQLYNMGPFEPVHSFTRAPFQFQELIQDLNSQK